MTGKIIKGTQPDESSPGLEKVGLSTLAGERHFLKGDVVQALASAEKIVEDARLQAQAIVDRAKAEEAGLRQRAQEEGYAEGLRELNQTILDFRTRYRAILENAEPEVLRLSLRIVERIIGKALELDPLLLVDIIHKALQSLKYQREIRIKIHPDDVSFLKANKMQLYTKLGESKEIEIVGDALVAHGGCIIDTEIGTIDARLETQLKVIEKILFKP